MMTMMMIMMMMMIMIIGNAVPRSIPKIQYILIPSYRFLSFSEASILKKIRQIRKNGNWQRLTTKFDFKNESIQGPLMITWAEPCSLCRDGFYPGITLSSYRNLTSRSTWAYDSIVLNLQVYSYLNAVTIAQPSNDGSVLATSWSVRLL